VEVVGVSEGVCRGRFEVGEHLMHGLTELENVRPLHVVLSPGVLEANAGPAERLDLLFDGLGRQSGVLVEVPLDVEDPIRTFEQLPLLDLEEISETVSSRDVRRGDLDQDRRMKHCLADSVLECAQTVVHPRLDECVEVTDPVELLT
jgi:hypothetical protein